MSRLHGSGVETILVFAGADQGGRPVFDELLFLKFSETRTARLWCRLPQENCKADLIDEDAPEERTPFLCPRLEHGSSRNGLIGGAQFRTSYLDITRIVRSEFLFK
jgi:hypothetical protein